jgi:hypothetical protein
MLGKSDFVISDAIGAFAEHGVAAAYFVPTPTGLAKGIIDAHAGVRDFLKRNGLHDFASQGLGNSEHGVKVDINLVLQDRVVQQKLSLYRPKTKSGDPRFWTNLNGFCEAFNLLALFMGDDGQLYLVNCSDHTTFQSISNPESVISSVLGGVNQTSPNTQLLLEKLRQIASMGWVDATKHGDTGIGHTLETLLGIEANSSKKPDFLDQIELKSSRVPPSGKSSNKSTMLSKVPDWKSGPLRAVEVLGKFGAISESSGRRELYVTVADKPNRQGLYLIFDERLGAIQVRHQATDGPDALVVTWDVTILQTELQNKNKETFWVKAERRLTKEGGEQFRYMRATRTQRPLVSNIGLLINDGKITLDFTLSEKSSGGVRDHGYLFRIWPKDLGLLFPAVEHYELT